MRIGKIFSARGQEVDFDKLTAAASKPAKPVYDTEIVRTAVESAARVKQTRGFVPPPEVTPAEAALITIKRKKT